MQVNAIISAKTTGNKDIKTTISYLRQSQESKASQLAIALNALTTNVYQSTQVNEIGIEDFNPGKPAVEIVTPSTTLRTVNYQGNNYEVLDIQSSNVPASEINVLTIYDQAAAIDLTAIGEVITNQPTVLANYFGYALTYIGTGLKNMRVQLGVAENDNHQGYFKVIPVTY